LFYRFEDHVLDTNRRELRRGEELLAVEPQVFDLLVFLISNRDRMVSKEDLIAAVWGGRIVSDSTLASRINAVRRTIGDNGREQRLIRTGARRGFRFAAPVEETDIKQTPGLVSQTVDEGPPLMPLDKPSIAVLPFSNLSGDPEQEYFVDGVVEEIITAIARVHWLFVIARNSSFTYKGRAVNVKQVARELGVRYVLEGSLRKSGDRVRITGQLIDTSTGAHIWADHIDSVLDDIFELQDRVASSVVGAIEPKLRQSEIERSARKPTQSVSAYDLFLRALGQLHLMKKESWSEAIRLAQQALDIDPHYAPAAALAAYTQVVQITQGWTEPYEEGRLAAITHLARNAVQYGREDPSALSMAAFAIAYCGDTQGADAAVERAVSLNPNDAGAWSVRGWIHCCLNRPKAAVEAFDRARRLSPFDPFSAYFSFGIGIAVFQEGRYEEALEWANRAVRDEGMFVGPLRFKVTLCGLLGRREEGRELLKRLLEFHPGLTVASFEAFYSRLFMPEIVALHVDGLRKAGLPET
jgi:TolB-like protein/tetratricopeptide (TPR) repeat protein